jgi:AcrR family transcriptional regulator
VVNEAASGKPGRAPRRRQSEILEAAARVFHEKGYEATSIQDIADAVGILKGSLYYYIDSKEDLLYEILERAHEEALQNVEQVSEVEGGALARIRAFVELHLAFNARNLVRMGVFFHDFRSLGDERLAVILEARRSYERFLRELIRDGQAEQVVCPDVDPKLAAVAILGMTNWIYHWYSPDGERSAAEIARVFGDLAVAGLACSPAEHEPGHRSGLGALPPGLV